MKYGPLKKALRQSPANNNAVAAGRTMRQPVPPLVPGGAFGTRGTSGKSQLGRQVYDRQAPAYPKQNNARPGSKVGHNAPSETVRDPATSTAQRQLMAIAEHTPSKVYKKNRAVTKMSKGQLHDFAATKGLKR